MGKAITTITIVQEGPIEERHLTKEYQEGHIEHVEHVISNIADGEVTVNFRLEEN